MHFPQSVLEQEHHNELPNDIRTVVDFDHENLSFIETNKIKQAVAQFGLVLMYR
jgi:hypothetical protein